MEKRKEVHSKLLSITSQIYKLIGRGAHVVLLASHDHEMLQSTCNRVIAFQPDGTIRDFYGTYDDYLAKVSQGL